MTPMTRRQIRHLADEIERMDREHGGGNGPAAAAVVAIRQLLRENADLQAQVDNLAQWLGGDDPGDAAGA